ncbi:alpha/beta hydrolase family protein [Cerasicoccus frondis]|uniref:alpha/beta hydrolase family protein n=1 Tax=Cerasicoccus frondis TaxID=490090 RepID=UPI002852C5CB|nr:hypothetical protein [Cerasicoccus frondis]
MAVQTLLLTPVDASRERSVPVKVYLPDTTVPAPVVLFSHGLGGSREGNAYLGEYWAKSGYIAIFLQHQGSDVEVWRDLQPDQRMAALKAAASVRSFMERLEDVHFILDYLELENAKPKGPLTGRLDLEKIGMSGHSFGAHTTQGLMGQRFLRFGKPRFKDDRIDCFIAMSPSSGRLPDQAAFGQITAPVLCMTGTDDSNPLKESMDPADRQRVYQGLATGDKYQLIFAHGQHSIFSDFERPGNPPRDPRFHPAIQEITTQFWNAYLKDDANAKTWLQSNAPNESVLIDDDVWEWK